MTRRRDFKRLVRRRMEETGERYSTARARILERAHSFEVEGAEGSDLDAPAPEAFPGLLPGYGACGGAAAATAALTNLLRHAGLRDDEGRPLDEATVHGLCGGPGFLYAVFEYEGHRPMLTVVARLRSTPDAFVAGGFDRLGVELSVQETTGAKRARTHLDAVLDAGRPALCTVDAAGLPHRGGSLEEMGMGPHVIGVVGRDGSDVWIDDRGHAPVRIHLDELARARAGYRKGRHRLVTVESLRDDYDLAEASLAALEETVKGYDRPPARPFASNVGTAGLRKWARLLTDDGAAKGWPRVFASGPEACVGLARVYDGVQHEYTAPDAGRPFFADFVEATARRTRRPGLDGVAEAFREVGKRWAELTEAIADCGDPAVERVCALADEAARLLDGGGEELAAEMKANRRERAAAIEACRLEASRARVLYAHLARIVDDIADRERAALNDLEGQLGG